jgi:hypothetical protein
VEVPAADASDEASVEAAATPTAATEPAAVPETVTPPQAVANSKPVAPAETVAAPQTVPAPEAVAPPQAIAAQPVEAAAEMRLWTDNTGKFQVRARLVKVLDGKVQLLKETGRTTTVPLDRLSAADLAFVERQAEALVQTEPKASSNQSGREF